MTPAELAATLGGTLSESFGLVTVDVPRERWVEAVQVARSGCGLSYFDWLSAVDEGAAGLDVVLHLWAPGTSLLLRTRVPADDPRVDSITSVIPGAAWHERETAEMFGIDFPGHPALTPLLLADGFAGHPLRKEFLLEPRIAKPWPGAVEPGGGRGRRRLLPPGVPEEAR